MSELVLVQACGTQADADLAKTALESAGIDAMIQADTAGGMRPHLAWSGFGFRILVRKEDYQVARDVLNPPEDHAMVFVHAFGTQDEADAAIETLSSSGIAAMAEDDGVSGWRPDASWRGTGFRLSVPKQDVEKTRQLLGLRAQGSR